MNHVVAIVGPTGIGKSKLAIHIAQIYNAEIINADSRQVYRHMDIGTAKPTSEELAQARHHLIDVINPDDDFSLAQYQALAYKAIDDIQQRHKLPLLVGGSGLYIWSVLEGLKIPEVPPDPELRTALEQKAANNGKDKLYQELAMIDPVAAKEIDPRNIRRVIRALEVQKKTGIPFSQIRQKQAPPFSTYIIGLTTVRADLYRRIDLRVDDMINRGLVTEVEKLVNMRYDLSLPAMSGIGYRQIGKFLKGELTLQAAVQQIKNETHRFVRRQYAWFQTNDNRIHWFDIQNQPVSDIAMELSKLIEKIERDNR